MTRNGKRCRLKVRGGAFCHYHLPPPRAAKKLQKRPSLPDRAEKAAKIGGGIFALVRIILKIIEFVAKHHEGMHFLRMPEADRMYLPNRKGIDWQEGRSLYLQALSITRDTSKLNDLDYWTRIYREVELKEEMAILASNFDDWYTHLNSDTKIEIDRKWSVIIGD